MKKSILINEQLHQELKIFCAIKGIKIKELIEKIIRENIKENECTKENVQLVVKK